MDTASIDREFIAQGDRGAAVEFFIVQVVGLPPEFAVGARSQPQWPAQEALAPTLADDADVMGDDTVPVERIQAVRVPTVILDGGVGFPWVQDTAKAVMSHLSDGRHWTLPVQEHT